MGYEFDEDFEVLANIHSSSVIDDQVQLADGVTVGPFCVIQGPVTIGEGTRLISHVTLKGPITIGKDNTFYPGVSIGFSPQSRRVSPDEIKAGVAIGDANIFREGVTIHRASCETPTTVGNENYLMVNAHLGHDVVLEDRCTLANAVLMSGHVHMASDVNIGGNTALHQFCCIGRLAMVSGTQGLVHDVPPFCTVHRPAHGGVSLNLIGLRRAGLNEHIEALKKAFRILYRQKHTNKVAIARIEEELSDDPLVMELADFVKNVSTRGIVQR